MAADDPEGPKMYEKLKKKVDKLKANSDIILVTKKDDALVNALQIKSDVVIQNSIREGFGMTVSEAQWQKTPVVGTRVGGIPLQIKHGKTGYLMRNEKEGANYCLKILNDDKLRHRLGENGKEHVKENFLITRQLKDYLSLFNHFLNKKKK
jgi:trehalose synthase